MFVLGLVGIACAVTGSVYLHKGKDIAAYSFIGVTLVLAVVGLLYFYVAGR